MIGNSLASAAEAMVGSPFRLNGRDPQTGLDCVGLLAASLSVIGREARFPSGYTLRTNHWRGLELLAEHHGFVQMPLCESVEPGDVCLFQPSPSQLHFAIAAMQPNQFIEAHAGLRRVVIMPGPYPYPLISHWRIHAIP